jgi:zinc protease
MQVINRKKAPTGRLLELLRHSEPRQITLRNGIPVYIVDEGLTEVLRIELVFKAGNFYQNQKHIAKATSALLAGGTSSHTADEISEHFDFYGSYLETSSAKDNAYVALYTLNKHLENTLPMLAEIIIDPVFPEQELEVYRANRLQHLCVNQQKVKYLARVYFNEQVFGSRHPYGMRLQAAHLEGLQRTYLQEHHRNYYRAEECMMVVSGKIPTGFELLLEKYFGGFKSNGSRIAGSAIAPISHSAEKIRFIKKNDALQAAIRIGKTTINRLHPDYPALFIANTILGGYFGSRLMHNIREDKGYTYGIVSGLASLQHSGLFVISSEVGTKVLKAAMKEIFSEIRKLREEKVSQEELSLVQNYLMGSLMRSMDGPFALAERLRTALEFGQTLDYYKEYAATIRQISAFRIQELAHEYLHEESLYQTVAGKQ